MSEKQVKTRSRLWYILPALILILSGFTMFSTLVIAEQNYDIPDWIKNNSKWWSEGKIGDDDFISGIQFLIDSEIIRIEKTTQLNTNYESQNIPSWIKNTASYWGNNQISDNDFLNAIEWLIDNGILKIVHSKSLEIQDHCVLQTDVQSLFPTREQAGDFYLPENYLYERKDGLIIYDGKSYVVFREMYKKGVRIEISLIKFDSCDTSLNYFQSEKELSKKGTVEYFEHDVKDVTECVGERWPLKYVQKVMLKCVKDNVYFISSIPRGPANDLSLVIRFAQYVVDNFE